jgi:hypothetical protein
MDGIVCDKCKTAHATIHLAAVDGCRKVVKHFCARCGVPENLGFPFAALAPELRHRLRSCPACRHVNPDNWIQCSACGASSES